ncbi:MAG: hypothetical protein VB108_05820 [Anaerolineaceae bacterium]|nr:hypothetical protein [Anaerolineaceae bacterium]
MFCIVSFIVLSILGIFSASNRALAKEALSCVGRRVTFRPCDTGFDEKIKARILGKTINRSEKLARFINKYFELLAWLFFMLMLAASILFLRGLYLFYTTGSCNGLNQSGFCAFDPTGKNNQVSSPGVCVAPSVDGKSSMTLDAVDLSQFPVWNAQGKERIVMVGCYTCEYTHHTYPMLKKLAQKYNAAFYFLGWPVHSDSEFVNNVAYVAYQTDKEKYWKLNDLLFAADFKTISDPANLRKALLDAGFEPDLILNAASSFATSAATKPLVEQILTTKTPGTPTVFIKDEVLIGPKPYRVYAIALKGLLYWLK